MSDPIDDLKVALADAQARIKALEDRAAAAAHAETQSLVKRAHDKIDALRSEILALESHVTATVNGALHSPWGVAGALFAVFCLGIAAAIGAQHLIG